VADGYHAHGAEKPELRDRLWLIEESRRLLRFAALILPYEDHIVEHEAQRRTRCIVRESRPANVLSLSRHVPSPAGQTDTRIYEARGAEAPDQRTARGRLL